jgi:hypothetical protein
MELANERGAWVQAYTLDSFSYRISLLKIDVENNELSVLEGAKETLRHVQHLFLELWSEDHCKIQGAECRVPETVQWLNRHGFEERKFAYTDNLRHFVNRRG